MAGPIKPLISNMSGSHRMTGTTKNFIKNRLPDFVRKSLGHRIMATIIVSITLVMGVEIVTGSLFRQKGHHSAHGNPQHGSCRLNVFRH